MLHKLFRSWKWFMIGSWLFSTVHGESAIAQGFGALRQAEQANIQRVRDNGGPEIGKEIDPSATPEQVKISEKYYGVPAQPAKSAPASNGVSGDENGGVAPTVSPVTMTNSGTGGVAPGPGDPNFIGPPAPSSGGGVATGGEGGLSNAKAYCEDNKDGMYPHIHRNTWNDTLIIDEACKQFNWPQSQVNSALTDLKKTNDATCVAIDHAYSVESTSSTSTNAAAVNVPSSNQIGAAGWHSINAARGAQGYLKTCVKNTKEADNQLRKIDELAMVKFLPRGESDPRCQGPNSPLFAQWQQCKESIGRFHSQTKEYSKTLNAWSNSCSGEIAAAEGLANSGTSMVNTSGAMKGQSGMSKAMPWIVGGLAVGAVGAVVGMAVSGSGDTQSNPVVTSPTTPTTCVLPKMLNADGVCVDPPRSIQSAGAGGTEAAGNSPTVTKASLGSPGLGSGDTLTSGADKNKAGEGRGGTTASGVPTVGGSGASLASTGSGGSSEGGAGATGGRNSVGTRSLASFDGSGGSGYGYGGGGSGGGDTANKNDEPGAVTHANAIDAGNNKMIRKYVKGKWVMVPNPNYRDCKISKSCQERKAAIKADPLLN